MVNVKPDSIPYRRCYLPFVKQSGTIAFEQAFYTDIRYAGDFGVSHI